MRTKSSSKHDMQEKDSKHRGKTETDKLASGETYERQDFTDDTLQNEDTTQLPLLNNSQNPCLKRKYTTHHQLQKETTHIRSHISKDHTTNHEHNRIRN